MSEFQLQISWGGFREMVMAIQAYIGLKSRQEDDTMRNIRWSYNLFWTVGTCKDWDSVSTCIIGLSGDLQTNNFIYLNLNFIIFYSLPCHLWVTRICVKERPLETARGKHFRIQILKPFSTLSFRTQLLLYITQEHSLFFLKTCNILTEKRTVPLSRSRKGRYLTFTYKDCFLSPLIEQHKWKDKNLNVGLEEKTLVKPNPTKTSPCCLIIVRAEASFVLFCWQTKVPLESFLKYPGVTSGWPCRPTLSHTSPPPLAKSFFAVLIDTNSNMNIINSGRLHHASILQFSDNRQVSAPLLCGLFLCSKFAS